MALGILSLALAIFVGFNITHAAPAGTSPTPTGDTDQGAPCTGSGATQTGDCNTEAGDQTGPDTALEALED
ncbi:MAG TPA: hypothetical protein VFE98_05170 [Candidatus Bathyarchaeia archaeon]|nr:hypothetical protein [Candidatus Bathyarchaeia archaeon]